MVRYGIAAFLSGTLFGALGLVVADQAALLHGVAALAALALAWPATANSNLPKSKRAPLSILVGAGALSMGVSLGWWIAVYLVNPLSLTGLPWMESEGESAFLEWAFFAGVPLGILGIILLLVAGMLRQSWTGRRP